MSEFTIRPYRRRDRRAILRITETSFEGFCLDGNIEDAFGPISGTTWQERKRAGIDHDLRQNPEHTFVAEADGEPVGYVCTRIYRTTRVGHVANVAVDRRYQGRGIGKALLRGALEHFRQCGMRYARIETLEQNYRGRSLYPSLGFEEVGRQVFFFREL
ncbi:MAG: GNAT family N-acetyltransferase [Gemmatimonadales bacterium]|nr:GNAT family N-acetyltransferase [Gemmatimonadales bacterium]NIR02697.1 GNAT family N-acetyltransferase [Gemmatimonadales bacterium]